MIFLYVIQQILNIIWCISIGEQFDIFSYTFRFMMCVIITVIILPLLLFDIIVSPIEIIGIIIYFIYKYKKKN